MMALTADPITTALAGLALYAGHHLGDRWIQTNTQALTKGQCSHQGRLACAGHVASLTTTQALMLALVAIVTGLDITPAAAALGLTVNAMTHYWADRRVTLSGLALALDPLTGKRGYYEHGGAEPLDQAWHVAWIVPSALVIAAPMVLALQLTGGALLVLVGCAVSSRLARRGERRQEREHETAAA